ncbi:methylated-DNA--[protein]-cysteine S-methyltransferase [Piscinibacter sp.]|uniref:methylated-DNA--[protein]-cysteine S-methyltransferase n=1 Tax=Piscinibacter sp. TaxID=1903157 RepID=UPI0039E6293D
MAESIHYAWFDTPLGGCAIVWGDAGVRGLMLPGADRARTLASLRRRHPGASEGAPTPAIAAAIAALHALLAGAPESLAGIALDLRGVPDFHRRVYEAARHILPGRTCTYGELAETLGDAGAARAVGQALGANPFAIIVPCHRVLAAGGASGGFSAPGGVATKLRLLEIERARFGGQPSLFDAS